MTIASANFNAADDHNGGAATIADNLLDGEDLITLTGVTDVTYPERYRFRLYYVISEFVLVVARHFLLCSVVQEG